MINKLLYLYQFLRNIYDNLFSNKLSEIKILKKYLNSKIIFFDIGYNLGFETNKIIKNFSKKILEVHAFEPNPNIKINTPPNVRLNRVAISNKKKKNRKFIIKKISSSSGLKTYIKTNSKDEEIIVKTISLKDYCKKNNVNKIDLMKIDVEGAELECLLSLGRYIQNIKLLKVELTNQNIFEVINFLSKHSFEFLGVTNTKYVNLKFSCSNAFFLNSKYRKNFRNIR